MKWLVNSSQSSHVIKIVIRDRQNNVVFGGLRKRYKQDDKSTSAASGIGQSGFD